VRFVGCPADKAKASQWISYEDLARASPRRSRSWAATDGEPGDPSGKGDDGASPSANAPRAVWRAIGPLPRLGAEALAALLKRRSDRGAYTGSDRRTQINVATSRVKPEGRFRTRDLRRASADARRLSRDFVP
jgi:hypothetical protein